MTAADNTERVPSGLEHALAEILTAVNHNDPVGPWDDYDDCSQDELHTHRELGEIRSLIAAIRVRNDIPVVTR